MMNNRGDYGYKDLRSEPNLDKFESRLNKSPEVSTSNTSPNKGKPLANSGKAGSQDEPRVGGLGRSASQKTLPPNKLKTSTFNRDRKNTLNSSTANFDPNSSVDNLNNSVMTVGGDMRKTYSDNKERPGTSKMYSTATSFGTYNKAKPPISGPRQNISNVGLISSPKAGAAKTKININSSPVTVKKKT